MSAKRKQAGGIACPECDKRYSDVIDSRLRPRNNTIRRRRLCPNGHRFTTTESIDVMPPPPLVNPFFYLSEGLP